MIYLSANGVKQWILPTKKFYKKTLINLKGRVDLDKTKFKNETELENYVDHFIQNIDNIQ